MRFITLFHKLSLDVVLGSMGGFAFACNVVNQRASLPYLTIVGVTVWIIYLSDHLADSLKQNSPASLKYSIFLRNRNIFVILILFLIIIDVLLIVNYLSIIFTILGGVLAIILLVYLTIQHFITGRVRKYFPKEFLISLIYIAALWFIPLVRSIYADTEVFLYLLIHFMLVLTNVMLFSYFERDEDLLHSRFSSLTTLPEKQYRTLTTLAGCLSFVGIIACMVLFGASMAAFVLLAISITYLLIISFSHKGFVRRYYAEITDGVFLLFMMFLV